MNAPFNTPQALATELLRVDQARRRALRSVPPGFYVVTRDDGSSYARPTLATLARLGDDAFDGTQMRVIEMGRPS
jgi:hypothetical protein